MRKWALIILAGMGLIMGEVTLAQSPSDLMLLRRPVVKNPLIYKLTKSVSEYYWGTKLFINCYSGTTGYVMTPSHELLSGMSFHIDHAWNRLVYAESQSNWIRAYGSRGSGSAQFLWPEAVDAHSFCNLNGYSPYYYVFILDRGNRRIIKIRYNWQTEAMEWLGAFGEGLLQLPSSFTINNGGTFLNDSDDYLWIVDRCYLKRFTPDGSLYNTYGFYGKTGGIGQFCTPSAIVCGRSADLTPPYDMFANNNYIYVADRGNQRIVWLEKSAESEDISWRGSVAVSGYIVGLETDNFGQVWAVDRENERIIKYTYDLFPLAMFGSPGTGENQFRFPYCIYSHGGYQGCGNMAVNESWTDSSGLQYFASGTDILDFEIDGSDNHRWHYIHYTLIDPSKVTIEIHGGPQKQFVKEIRAGSEWSGQSFYVWNGQKEDGTIADSGWYSVVVFDTSLYTNIDTGEPANNVQFDVWFYHAKNPYINYIPGDVNNDGNVDMSDAVYIINFVFKGGPGPQPFLCVADVNADGSIDIGDPVYIISYIFKGGAAPLDGCQIAP